MSTLTAGFEVNGCLAFGPTHVYQGNTVKVTDPAGKWKKFLYDAFGNLTKVTEPNPAGDADHETNYTYNLVNKRTQVSMPRGSVTQSRSFTYAFTTQRLASTTNPENGTVSYTYNSDGTVASKTRADGLSTRLNKSTNVLLS